MATDLYDLRAVSVSDDLVSIEIERRHAPCQMHCRFCPRTVRGYPRDLPPPSERMQATITQRFAELVLGSGAGQIYLHADDPLAYPGLTDLLDVAAREGRRVHVSTPGLALADRTFAERFVGYDLRFDLTVHGPDAATFEVMTGRADAAGLVEAAIANLEALQIEWSPMIVVTAHNVQRLAETVAWIRARTERPQLRVALFYPDLPDAPAAYYAQAPAFEAVVAQLVAVASAPGGQPLEVANLPPCQLSAEVAGQLALRLTPDFNTHRRSAFEVCAACPAADRCARVHPTYLRHHTPRPPDLEAVTRVLEALASPPALAAPAPQGGAAEPAAPASEPPLARLPLLPEQGLFLTVESPGSDRTYWFHNHHLGVWCTEPTADTPAVRRAAALLTRVRRRLEQGDPDGVGVDDLARVAAWVRDQLG